MNKTIISILVTLAVALVVGSFGYLVDNNSKAHWGILGMVKERDEKIFKLIEDVSRLKSKHEVCTD